MIEAKKQRFLQLKEGPDDLQTDESPDVTFGGDDLEKVQKSAARRPMRIVTPQAARSSARLKEPRRSLVVPSTPVTKPHFIPTPSPLADSRKRPRGRPRKASLESYEPLKLYSSPPPPPPAPLQPRRATLGSDSNGIATHRTSRSSRASIATSPPASRSLAGSPPKLTNGHRSRQVSLSQVPSTSRTPRSARLSCSEASPTSGDEHARRPSLGAYERPRLSFRKQSSSRS